MSSIVTDQGIVHYEAYGRGEPVVLLHGWLGSWGYWLDTMEALGRYYRLYALDFWGFGDSGKRRERYLVTDFVDLVEQFMERLGIVRAPIIGHSMGGTVALSVALGHPQLVSKVAVVGSRLHELHTPVMSINGAADNVVNPNQATLIGRWVPGSRVEIMASSGHFPMLDEPESFNENLYSFLKS
jgi:pimeloyl-ACP methyl ester carboxylesterase